MSAPDAGRETPPQTPQSRRHRRILIGLTAFLVLLPLVLGTLRLLGWL